MSWTIQTRWRGDSEWQSHGSWEDWSGHQAYDLLEKAASVLVSVLLTGGGVPKKTFHRWQWQIVDKDTGEVVPAEIFA